jgi:neurofibromin 1
LYLQLFRSLETELNVVLDPTKDGYAQIETRTLFTEQVCSLLKTIVDRLEETQDTFLSVDLGAMTLSLARYLETLKDDATTLRVKIRMCYLVEVVARKKKIVNLRHDMKIRNHLLQILSEWMSRSNKVDSPYSTAQGYKRDEFIRLQRDLDRACLRAVVNLLDRLSLQPPEVAHDVDMLDARSNMFSVYFNAFLALLDQGQSSIDNTRTADSQTASLARDDAESFRSLAIQALSNLLSANVDVGLKYSLEVGYHESLSTRTAFMQVLTNILTQGTEFGTLGDTAIGEKYEHLIDVSQPN